MAGLWIPRGFQKPPVGARINWAHPLAAGLGLCYVFNEEHGGVTAVDLVEGRVGTGVGATLLGGGLDMGVAGIFPCGDYAGWDGSATYTIVSRVLRRSTGSTDSIVAQWSGGGSTLSRILHYDTGNTLYGLAYDGSTFAGAQSGAIATDTTAPHTVAMTQTTATAMVVHYDGVQVGSGTFASTTPNNSSLDLMIGNHGSTGTPEGNFDGVIYFAYIWPTRALTAEDHAQLHAEPYCFLTR
jgi:Concanavalin A-like lectin/glucanases superfamily